MQPTRAQRRAILALTFATGGAGLIYQVVWQRYLARLLGSDSLATATVLAVFLAGLSLGYRAWGRRSLHGRGLLRTYGWLECAIGAWALVFPLWFGLVDRWSAGWRLESPWSLAGGGAVCAILLIGFPTFCMGGTVPILTRALTVLLERATTIHSRVYAVNTAGAVAGALGTGFYLIHRLGLPNTLRLAAALNIVAGLYFLASGRRRPAERAARVPRETSAGRLGWRLAAIALLSGFYFMTLESLWIRFTRLSIGSSSFTFSLVVGAVVLAIALGAWLAGRRDAQRPDALFRNQYAAAVAVAVLFATLDSWPWAAYAIRVRFPSTDPGFAGYNVAVFAAILAAIGIPAGLMGATLPLTFDAAAKTLQTVGRQAGALLGWNALGCLLGGFVGGYLLLARLNLGETYLVALFAVLASAWIAAAPFNRSRLVAVVCLTGAIVALTAWFPYDPLRFSLGTFRVRKPIETEGPTPAAFYETYYRHRTVLAYRDDPEGTFAVVENLTPEQLLISEFPILAADLFENDPEAAGRATQVPRSIVVNGKSDSSTYYDRETLRLSAHLPALFGVVPDRALVVGLGTGVTAGELTLYPEVRSIRVAEISTAVRDFLPFFGDAIHGLAEDPRYTLVAGDAFRVLRRSDERYNVIVSEPSNPWVLGVDQLFSREFYASVARRLEPDGVFVQWIQRYATTREVHDTVVRTLRNEFPHLRAFRGAEHDDLFVASKRPLTADVRMSNPAVALSLAEIGLLDLEDLLEREIFVPASSGDGALETLDRPRIHHLSGRAFFRGETMGEPAPAR